MLRALLKLFSRSTPFVPPTRRQLEYAELCGVRVTRDMDRDAVSTAIDDAFAADPKLRFKVNARRNRKAKSREDAAAALPAAEKRALKKWSAASAGDDHFLVVYTSGRETVVDIIECTDASIDPQSGAVVVEFYAPRVENVVAGWVGDEEVREDELRWDEPLTLWSTDILESRKLQIYEDQVKKYRSTIARKMKALGLIS